MASQLKEVRYVDLAGQYQEHRQEILEAIDAVLTSGQYILGPQIEIFEKAFAELCGVRHAIAVADGTASLTLCMKVLGIGPGDEVITSPNSWISSASSIIHAGATPVFVDVRPDQNMNPALLEKAITNKTKAIIPVHLTGKMADMAPIMEIAKKYGLKVIEDAAQAVGAQYRGRKAGSIGDFGSFSLHPLKNLNGAGDGGIITTNDENMANELRLIRNHGIVTRDHIAKWGYNCRLDSLQAAILNVKLKYLNEVTTKRRLNAQTYYKKLSSVAECPVDQQDCLDVYHLFVIQVDNRDALQKFLKENGTETAIHYPVPIHLLKAAEKLGYKVGSFPECERQASRILSLPIHQGLTLEQVNHVADLIIKFVGGKK